MTESVGGLQNPPERTIEDILAQAEEMKAINNADPRFGNLVADNLSDSYLIAESIRSGAITVVTGAELIAVQKATAEKDAIIDPMTGLYRKEAFELHLETEIARSKRARTPLSVSYLDLDDFSLVNNEESHENGHAVLSVVGNVLRSDIREYDLAGRCGGEEIVLTFSNTTAEQAKQRLQEITHVLPDQVIGGVRQQGIPFDRRITASVGIAEVVPTDPNFDLPAGQIMRLLLDTADQRMRMAKIMGKNTVVGEQEEQTFRADPQLMEIGRTGKYRIH